MSQAMLPTHAADGNPLTLDGWLAFVEANRELDQIGQN
jgi:hypothetical protein